MTQKPIHRISRQHLGALLLGCLLAPATWAGTLIDLNVEASQAAPNDLFRATVFAENSGSNLKTVSSRTNEQMAEATQTGKRYNQVKLQSGSTSTYPVYGKAGRIESWRMRSELQLESKDAEKLSELLGQLQDKLGLSSVQFLPSPETRKQAEEKAIQAALAAFQERAGLIARSLGKTYRIKQLNVSSNGQFQPPMMYRKASSMMAEAAAPMPMEAGESQIQVNVGGQIELAD